MPTQNNQKDRFTHCSYFCFDTINCRLTSSVKKNTTKLLNVLVIEVTLFAR
jgi:hypothetical protein